MKHFDSSGRRTAGDALSAAQIRTGRHLFYWGCGITLLYFWSGLLHAVLGSGVYARDVLLLGHLALCIHWLRKTGQLRSFLNSAWPLAIPAVFILPALGISDFRVEALTFVKWTAIWLDWVILGQLAYSLVNGFETPVIVILIIAAALLLGDAATGFYEMKTKSYVLEERGRVSAFGVAEVREEHLEGELRVKGLQRDVFSYANLMGMSVVAGMLVFVSEESLTFRLASLGWMGLFSGALFLSGGRSAFFGVLGAGLIATGLVTAMNPTRKYYGSATLGWLAIGLLISAIGVGRLAESVGGSVMAGSSIGNADSAYMRDANWQGIIEAIKNVPVVLVAGAPISSLIEPSMDAFYHWADNEYLWLIYHTSIIGFLAPIFYFSRVVRLPADENNPWVRDALVLFLIYVMGEAIARESMTFLGCLPLFLACGWQGAAGGDAADMAQRPGRGAPFMRPKPDKARSQTADFARRIREASRKGKAQ